MEVPKPSKRTAFDKPESVQAFEFGFDQGSDVGGGRLSKALSDRLRKLAHRLCLNLKQIDDPDCQRANHVRVAAANIVGNGRVVVSPPVYSNCTVRWDAPRLSSTPRR